MTRSLPAFSSILVLILLGTPRAGQAQGLPAFAPVNPLASSRSGLYFQPFHDPAPGRWTPRVALDYASVIEYNRLGTADYVLDSEILRLGFGVSRDISPRMFVDLSASVGGAYAGFLDGLLDWYHRVLGIRLSERDSRPKDQFLYTIAVPDGRKLTRTSSDLFLGDFRVGLGLRYTSMFQSVLSLTFPTSTGPDGYGRGVTSVGVLNTVRAPIDPRLLFEGSLDLGLTPSHGWLSDLQRTSFLAASSGLRFRFWGHQSLYANLFYHSPYYHDTSLPSLDRRELSLDFGWILQRPKGREWRVGLTEDLEPGGPGVDLIFRLGKTF